MAGRITLKQVAWRAQCSVAVASSVLNRSGGTARYSAEVAQRVRQAAIELGYQRRMPRTGPRLPGPTITIMVGIAAPGGSAIETLFLREATRQLDRCGFGHQIVYADSRIQAGQLLERIAKGTVEAAITFVMGSPTCEKVFRDEGIPLVMVNSMEVSELNGIFPDDAGGVRQAVRLLAGAGCRRLAYVDGPRGCRHYSMRLRGQTLRDESERAGMQWLEWHNQDDWDVEAVSRLLSAEVDAIVGFSDRAVTRVADCFRELGLRLPEACGVLSLSSPRPFEDRPETTCLETPFAAMGRLAADMIVDLWRGRQAVFENILVPESVWIGSSLDCRRNKQKESR